QGSGNIDRTPSMPHDLPFLRVNTLVSDEGSMTLNELMVLCTKLSQKVDSLKEDLKHTKQIYEAAYTKLIMKVKSTISASMPVSTVGMVDKGKAIMQESKPEQTITKLQQKQERASYEAIVRLLKQLDEEGRKRIARVHEETSSFNVDE
nr:hypothetical protein [Tanacetum cinerariifolium]